MTYRLLLMMIISFLIAGLLQFLPVPGLLESWVPQWVALVMVYWALALDDRFKLVLPCFIGLCLDVMNGSMLGLHALALLWLSFIVLKNGRQLRRTGRIQQIFEVGVLILSYQMIIFAIQGMIGQRIMGWAYFESSVSSAIIWPWVSVILGERSRRFLNLKTE